MVTDREFLEARRRMLEGVLTCDGAEVRRVIPWRECDDVSRYLDRLDRLEEEARYSRLIAE